MYAAPMTDGAIIFAALFPFVIMFVMMFVLTIVPLVLALIALISLLRKDAPTNDKILWAIVVIFVGIIGPILYLAMGAKQLDTKSRGVTYGNE